MNGYTPIIPQSTRLQNLAAAIPQQYRARAFGEALALTPDGNPHSLENVLTGFVLHKGWEKWQQADEIAADIEWLDPSTVSTGLERDGAATGISQPEIF